MTATQWGFVSPVWLNSGTGQFQGGTNRDVLYEIKETLKSAGATVVRSGDGSSYSVGTDLIDSGTTFGNANAHIELQIGSAGPWYSIQHVSGGQFRLKRRATAFSGGSPGASRVEGGGDIIFGGGTDASPTGGNSLWMSPLSPGYICGGADSASGNGFWFARVSVGSGQTSAWVHDPVLLPTTGDTDPAMSVIGYSASAGFDMFCHINGNINSRLSRCDRAEPRTPHGYNVDGALWDSMGLGVPYGNRGGLDWPDDGVPGNRGHIGVYHRNTGIADPTVKGTSTIFAWFGGPTDRFGDTFDWRGQSDALMQIGDVVVPWNGTVFNANQGEAVIHGLDDFSSDTVAPTITNVSPASGTQLATQSTPIQFDVTDLAPGVQFVIVTAKFANRRDTQIVYDGSNFKWPFDATGSQVTAITNGLRFAVAPRGRWIGDIEELFVYAIDSAGNLEGSLP